MLAGIDKIYLTGINTDPILYRHLRELIEYLQWRGFRVGIRTNGYVALQRLKDVIDDLDDEIGLSIPSFNLDTIYSITGRRSIPKWGEICRYLKEKQKHWRISTVACYQNREELHPILRLAALLRPDYLQIRRIATDHRSEDFKEDWAVYDAWKAELAMLKKGEFYEADVDVWQNLPVCFWETVNTTVNSYNYFTDGTSTTNYFVVEGYENSDRSRPS
jgi:pyruvate-formate lyase-activating enzyme